jgi:tetratricopeptide (TPR) repeat protein
MATPRVPLPPEPVPAPCAQGGDIACFREELGPTAGRALAALARAVDAWVQHAPAVRADVDPECIPELSLTLQALLRLTRDRSRDAATAEAVGFGCYNLAEWAEEKGAIRSALHWAQKAIVAWPQHPQYAYLIGRLARRSAEYDHAEHWLRYAMRLSRRRGEWETYALSLSGFGNLKRQRGNHPQATRYHRLALKLARRHGLRTIEGDALYDLAVGAIEQGEIPRALSLGREAIRAYGPGHTRIHRLAHDFAWLLMNDRGDYFHAAYVFQALKPHIWDPDVRLAVVTSLCRAAAGAGWEKAFETSWVDAWVLIRTATSRERHAGALIQLAYAAAAMGSLERARLAVQLALEVALERREGFEIVTAERILQVLDRAEENDAELESVFPDLRREVRVATAGTAWEDAAHFAEDVALALRARRDNPAGQSPCGFGEVAQP